MCYLDLALEIEDLLEKELLVSWLFSVCIQRSFALSLEVSLLHLEIRLKLL